MQIVRSINIDIPAGDEQILLASHEIESGRCDRSIDVDADGFLPRPAEIWITRADAGGSRRRLLGVGAGVVDPVGPHAVVVAGGDCDRRILIRGGIGQGVSDRAPVRAIQRAFDLEPIFAGGIIPPSQFRRPIGGGGGGKLIGGVFGGLVAREAYRNTMGVHRHRR